MQQTSPNSGISGMQYMQQQQYIDGNEYNELETQNMNCSFMGIDGDDDTPKSNIANQKDFANVFGVINNMVGDSVDSDKVLDYAANGIAEVATNDPIAQKALASDYKVSLLSKETTDLRNTVSVLNNKVSGMKKAIMGLFAGLAVLTFTTEAQRAAFAAKTWEVLSNAASWTGDKLSALFSSTSETAATGGTAFGEWVAAHTTQLVAFASFFTGGMLFGGLLDLIEYCYKKAKEPKREEIINDSDETESLAGGVAGYSSNNNRTSSVKMSANDDIQTTTMGNDGIDYNDEESNNSTTNSNKAASNKAAIDSNMDYQKLIDEEYEALERDRTFGGAIKRIGKDSLQAVKLIGKAFGNFFGVIIEKYIIPFNHGNAKKYITFTAIIISGAALVITTFPIGIPAATVATITAVAANTLGSSLGFFFYQLLSSTHRKEFFPPKIREILLKNDDDEINIELEQNAITDKDIINDNIGDEVMGSWKPQKQSVLDDTPPKSGSHTPANDNVFSQSSNAINVNGTMGGMIVEGEIDDEEDSPTVTPKSIQENIVNEFGDGTDNTIQIPSGLKTPQ